MDLQYFGGNCVVLSSKGVRLVFDDNLADLGERMGADPASWGDQVTGDFQAR